MTYAIRFNSQSDFGMLVEMPHRALAKIIAAQDAGDEARDAYWDTPDEARGPIAPPPQTYPYYERTSADRAHRWVRDDRPHETLLFLDDRKIRRA